MVTATKKSDKPKKKSVKKGPKAPKAPVGRPRKNLGTRISDLPLVSTIKPAARRANVDSIALQRAKMQFKRDYPGVNVDEYQTRALLDVMQDPSRGAIGSRVLGPAEKTVLAQQIEEEKKAKELAAKLKKAKDKGKAIVTIDGNTYANPKVLNRILTTLPVAPLPVAPFPIAPLPIAPGPVPVAAKSRRINVRSAAKKVKIGKPPVGTPFKDTKEGKMAEDRRSQVFDTKLPRMAREADEAEARGEADQADKIRAAAFKLAELAENRYTRDRATWEASQRTAPSTSARSPASSRDLKKAKSIADKLVSPSNSEDSANAKALDAGTMFKESSPEVQAAVIQDLSQRVQDAPAGSDLAQVAIPEARSQLLVQTQRAFDELQQASDEELGRRLAEEAARQYGQFRPPTEQELAGQRAMEEIDIQQARPTKKQIEEYGKKIEQQLRAEQEEPVPVFRPRRQGPRDYLLEPFTPAEQAAADVVNKMAKARKASKAFQEQRSAATAMQAAVRRYLETNRPVEGPEYDEEEAKKRDAAIAMQALLKRGRTPRFSPAIEVRMPTMDTPVPSESFVNIREIQDPRDIFRHALQGLKAKEQEADILLPVGEPAFTRKDRPFTPEDLASARLRKTTPVTRNVNPFSDASAFRSQASKLKPTPPVIREEVSESVSGVSDDVVASLTQFLEARRAQMEARNPERDWDDDPPAYEESAAGTTGYQIAGEKYRPGAVFRTDPNPISSDVEKRFRYNAPMRSIFKDSPGKFKEVYARPYVPALSDEEREAIGERDLEIQQEGMQPNTSDRIIVPGTYRQVLDDHPDPSVEAYGEGLVGGRLATMDVIIDELHKEAARRRLRGMGYFDGYDSLTYNIHGTPDDNKKDLAAAKAAYAAKGGAMGGGSDWTLQAVTFPDKDWKTSSSLRWLRSNGIKPIKKADKQGTLFRYRITDPKGFTEYYTSDLMSRGRKIHLVYGK